MSQWPSFGIPFILSKIISGMQNGTSQFYIVHQFAYYLFNLLFEKSVCNLFPLHFQFAMFVIIFLLQEVFDMIFILNCAKEECCLLPKRNEYHCVTSNCRHVFCCCPSLRFFVDCFSPLCLCCENPLSVCLCMFIQAVVTALFSACVWRSSVTNKGFTAVLGSFMFLTSFSHMPCPHHADHFVPNHSTLLQQLSSPFPAIPFCSTLLEILFSNEPRCLELPIPVFI